MQLKLEKQEEKPLVERKEIVVKIISSTTLSNTQVKEKIATLLKCSQDLIVVKKIDQLYGKQEAVVKAYIYKNKDALKIFEPKAKKEEAEKKEEKK